MKTAIKLMLIAMLIPILGYAQEEESKDYHAVEAIYLKPKMGSGQKLIAAIKEHNRKYHSESPFGAGLYSISVGEEAGWMVWTMGGFTYSELDDAPGEGEHMDHWRKNVEPHVGEYGRVEHWRFAENLSHRLESGERPLEIAWMLDIEPAQYYKFKEFMTKIQEVYAKQGEEMEVWNNMYSGSNGRDAAIFWPVENWAALDSDDWKMSEVYEEVNGEGSWRNALTDWGEFIKGMDQEVWYREL